MKFKYVIPFFFMLLFVACEKEDTQVYPTVLLTDFDMPSTIGSYWLYQWYSIDSNGVETPYGTVDSLYYAGDTTINTKQYSVVKGTWLGNPNYVHYHRDSSGYFVDQNGKVEFSYQHFNTIIEAGTEPPYWVWNLQMVAASNQTVPAGVFNAIEARRIYADSAGGLATTCGDTTFTLGNWYADGIGKIKEKSGFMSQLQNCTGYLEARLIDYYIQ